MRYETQTVRIGEWLGPVDWSYYFTQHNWGPSKGGVNPECTSRGADVLREVEQHLAAGRECWISDSGFDHQVIHCGMYDGWPFWKPTPAVLYIGPLKQSGEVCFFYNLDRAYVREAQARAAG